MYRIRVQQQQQHRRHSSNISCTAATAATNVAFPWDLHTGFDWERKKIRRISEPKVEMEIGGRGAGKSSHQMPRVRVTSLKR